jgi:2-iminoacetate synthase
MSILSDKKKLSRAGRDFIDEERLHELMKLPADAGRIEETIAKSLSKQALEVEETAALLSADTPALWERIFAAARQLKRDVYGNRIVIFAPLYVGNECTNDCRYCAFRRSNRDAVRRTLTEAELAEQVLALEAKGHKRLILVFGEHPRYNPEYIAACVRRVYATRRGRGEIRRVNVNAAPQDHAGYAAIKAAGIGTYQIFQETYHHETFRRAHPADTLKGDYLWRLDGVARAMEAGCDDVGIGALFGLYDWRFETLALVAHARHLQQHYNVGPHTISFPRLRPAQGVRLEEKHLVNDADFMRLVAVLRLSVPYTGLILTAREPAALRRQALAFGVSQIDAGSRIELGGYTEVGDAQVMEREQFTLGDVRSLDEVMRELLIDGYVPSFCTACYRLGRTGEHFMEYAIPGFIQNFCTPNALTTLQEYLLDHATPETAAAGREAMRRELDNMPDGPRKTLLIERLRQIAEEGRRDLLF